MISRTLTSKDPSPGRAAPLIGNSGCAGPGTGGTTGGAVGSPPHEMRIARQAIEIVLTAADRIYSTVAILRAVRNLIDVFARFINTVS
jgi:hypothetical protein